MFQDEKRSLHGLFLLLNKLGTTATKQERGPSVAMKNHDVVGFDLVNFELPRDPQVLFLKLVSVTDNGTACCFCGGFEILVVYHLQGEDSLSTKLVGESIVHLGSADQDTGPSHPHLFDEESPQSVLFPFEQLNLPVACDVQLDRERTFVFRLRVYAISFHVCSEIDFGSVDTVS